MSFRFVPILVLKLAVVSHNINVNVDTKDAFTMKVLYKRMQQQKFYKATKNFFVSYAS